MSDLPPDLSRRLVGFVVTMFELTERRLTLRQVEALGEAGKLLQQWRVLHEVENARLITCEACDADHDVELEYDPEAHAWRSYCGIAGYTEADPKEMRLFCLDRNWLLQRLGICLKIERVRLRELLPGVLWDLGDSSLGGRTWTAFLARSVAVHLDEILEALHSRGGKLPGLMLTTSPSVPYAIPLPYGHRFLALEDCLKSETEGLSIAQEVIVVALRRSVGERAMSKVGRPELTKQAMTIFTQRLDAGETAERVGAEAQAIRERMLLEHVETKVPVRRTIENVIRDQHAHWRKHVHVA